LTVNFVEDRGQSFGGGLAGRRDILGCAFIDCHSDV